MTPGMLPLPGVFTVLCGPNGAGKSTWLRGFAGLAPGGVPRPREVAYLAQGARCEWGMSAREVIALGRLPHGDRDPAAIAAAAAAAGVTHLLDRRVDRISGGEQRKVMLARVLATEAGILLLDEPTNDLDPAAAHQIMRLLQAQARQGRMVVAVLHAVELALRYADMLWVMDNGVVTAAASPLEALPEAAKAFGMRFGSDPQPRLLPP